MKISFLNSNPSGRRFALLISLVLLGTFMQTCKVGDNYERPEKELALEDKYRNIEETDSTTLAQLPWRDIFDDPVLVALIDSGLNNNMDLLRAVARINESRAYVKEANSSLLPHIGVDGQASRAANSDNSAIALFLGDETGGVTASNLNNYKVGVGLMSYEIDLWGKLRRSKESALAKMLETEAARQTIQNTVIAEIASNYYDLIRLDQQLQITQANIALRQKTYDLIKLKNDKGVESGLALKQVESVLYNAKAMVPQIEQQIQIRENALNLLVGRYPTTLERGKPLGEQTVRENLPTGIPTQLLVYRPDVVAAEMNLASTNADIGVAKAYFYPSLTISAGLGYESVGVSNLFQTPESIFWNIAAGLTAPIFQGGRNKARLRQAEARMQQAYIDYRYSVMGAVKEVADAVISIEKTEQQYQAKLKEVQARQKAVEYSEALFSRGSASYLEVIEAQRYTLTAELELSDIRKNQLIAIINLYKALGGGWDASPNETAQSDAE
ncbi:efflux transporter outer membrane subunit [bacterium SCSIO 12741]|nr:efflux transporter outer membrane subunit [bacterium SCSIO 12741]